MITVTLTPARPLDLDTFTDLAGVSASSLTPNGDGTLAITWDLDALPDGAADAITLRAETRTENERTLRLAAANALAKNADYLALATPTNAQNVAQLRALTTQVNALIRVVARTV